MLTLIVSPIVLSLLLMLVVIILERLNFLNVSGALATILLGLSILFFFHPAYIIYPVVFLLLGSLASKLNKPADAERKGRTAVQVLANGGPSLLIVLASAIYPKSAWFGAFIVCYAVALSDTLSSEFGKYFKHPTYDVVGFKPMAVGLSGGVSWSGTLAGFIGSGIIAFVAYLLGHAVLSLAVVIWFAGFGGMLVDSVLGSIFQSKYNLSGKIKEHGSRENLVSGIHWVDNHWVNFLSIVVLALLYVLVCW